MPVISIDTLPNDVLLVIFHHHVYDAPHAEERQKAWQLLVHVCRRWRSIVYGSPRHLDLQLVCTEKTHVRDKLDVWPNLPLSLSYDGKIYVHTTGSLDNIIAGLERTDRVRRISFIDILDLDLEEVLTTMQKPFPNLTHMELLRTDSGVYELPFYVSEDFFDPIVDPVVPDSFLGESAPRLRYFALLGISFPALPKLLLSATHLENLYLENIPHSGYYPPDVMVTVLTMLTSLNILMLGFESPQSLPDRASRRPPSSTRSVLPVLTVFSFKGVSEYLEDLVADIDAPQMGRLFATFFNDIVFDPPQFMQFISRTPMSRTLEEAHVTLEDGIAGVTFLSRTPVYRRIDVKSLCTGLDGQVSSLEQVCTLCLPRLSTLEALYIYKCPNSQLDLKEKIENGLWLELLYPFSAVKNLYVSEEFASPIALVLQELAVGRTTEVLPALQNIFLEGLDSSGPVEEGIGQFVAARQVAGHPIAISSWTNSEQDKE